jgi:hypothetical protein
VSVSRSGSSLLNGLSIASTLADALRAFRRGDKASGAALLGAAALSVRIPGVGVLASILLRVRQRLR